VIGIRPRTRRPSPPPRKGREKEAIAEPRIRDGARTASAKAEARRGLAERAAIAKDRTACLLAPGRLVGRRSNTTEWRGFSFRFDESLGHLRIGYHRAEGPPRGLSCARPNESQIAEVIRDYGKNGFVLLSNAKALVLSAKKAALPCEPRGEAWSDVRGASYGFKSQGNREPKTRIPANGDFQALRDFFSSMPNLRMARNRVLEGQSRDMLAGRALGAPGRHQLPFRWKFFFFFSDRMVQDLASPAKSKDEDRIVAAPNGRHRRPSLRLHSLGRIQTGPTGCLTTGWVARLGQYCGVAKGFF